MQPSACGHSGCCQLGAFLSPTNRVEHLSLLIPCLCNSPGMCLQMFPLFPVEFCLIIELSMFSVCSRQTCFPRYGFCKCFPLIGFAFLFCVCRRTKMFNFNGIQLMNLPVELWSQGFHCCVANLACAGVSTRPSVRGVPSAPSLAYPTRDSALALQCGRRPAHVAVSSPSGVCPPAASSTAPLGQLAFCIPGLFPGSRVFGALFYLLSRDRPSL